MPSFRTFGSVVSEEKIFLKVSTDGRRRTTDDDDDDDDDDDGRQVMTKAHPLAR